MGQIRIIRGDDSVEVRHVIAMICGDPGAGKTTLGFDAKDPVLLDFDKRIHAAKNRKDAIDIENWGTVHALLNAENESLLEPYGTVIIDTVGRALDMLSVHLQKNKAYGNGAGGLSPLGWGKLKSEFQQLITGLKTRGKDIVFLSHSRRVKDGERTIIRADIQGGSYDEIYKMCDFIGFLFFDEDGRRVLDFNSIGGRIAKNTAGIERQTVPDLDIDAGYFDALLDTMKSRLGSMAGAQREAFKIIEEYKGKVAHLQYDDEFDLLLEEVNTIEHQWAMKQVKLLMKKRGEETGVRYNTEKGKFAGNPRPIGAEPSTSSDSLLSRIKTAKDASILNGLHYEAEQADPDLLEGRFTAMLVRAAEIGVEWVGNKKMFRSITTSTGVMSKGAAAAQLFGK